MTLITQEYREMQEKLHETRDDYGMASLRWVDTVIRIINKKQPKSLLDYGAGKQRLEKALKEKLETPLPIISYDPAVPHLSATPPPCDLVTCIDVLEHIEPNLIENVLDDLKRVTGAMGLFTISTVPAKKTLDDGRNAHLIQEGSPYWIPRILSRFRIIQFTDRGHDLVFIVQRLDN